MCVIVNKITITMAMPPGIINGTNCSTRHQLTNVYEYNIPMHVILKGYREVAMFNNEISTVSALLYT